MGYKIAFSIILLLSSGFGLEFNKQNYNPGASTDFLQHEGGYYGQKNDPHNSNSNTNQNTGKRDYVALFPPLSSPTTPKTPTVSTTAKKPDFGKRDYVADQFPQPPSPTSPKTPTSATPAKSNSQISNGKRDYVAPQYPTLKPIYGNNQPSPVTSKTPTSVTPSTSPKTPTSATPAKSNSQISNGKRDYVAPQYPTLKPIYGNNQPSPVTSKSPTSVTPSTGNTQPSGGKRDYVAPQYPTLKPTQGNNQPTGKVKDLINFYDRQNNGQTTPKVPSYSSILQGSSSLNPQGSTSTLLTHTTPKSPSPTKPSFSNILSGSKSPSTLTTSNPSTQVQGNSATVRPIVLPSSIVNKNQNSVISSGPATDLELQTLSEELLRKDVNNAAKFITINYQDKTTSQSPDDKASAPLLTISPDAWNIPTIQKFVPLLDNYERDTLVNEYITPLEKIEENDFMDAIMSTSVIRHLMNFLKVKRIVTADPKQQRDFLKQLWFSLYSRGRGKIGSSGFEHIFVSELKNGQVSGLHNWIYFAKEEAANRINYLGYLKYSQLSDKGAVLKHHFVQQGVDKPVDTMFIGTSPELEMALYTLCFVTRADNDCKLKLGNNDVDIVSHTFRYRSKDLIGSAYPQI